MCCLRWVRILRSIRIYYTPNAYVSCRIVSWTLSKRKSDKSNLFYTKLHTDNIIGKMKGMPHTFAHSPFPLSLCINTICCLALYNVAVHFNATQISRCSASSVSAHMAILRSLFLSSTSSAGEYRRDYNLLCNMCLHDSQLAVQTNIREKSKELKRFWSLVL